MCNHDWIERGEEKICLLCGQVVKEEKQGIDKFINQIIHGDCLETLKTLPDNSVDSIVTDPPYELGFMGKKWDSTGIAYNVDLWKECLRVLKPGGHLLAFGGTRTYHRMACAIEDAGFQVRDMIQWIYGCLDEKTEVLTEKGWVNYKEITKKEKIACFNKDTEEIIYYNPEEIFIYPFDGYMYRINGRTLDQMLTPNHRVLLKETREKGHRKNNFYETEWIFKEVQNLTPNRGIRLPLAGKYKGTKSVGVEMAELIGWIISEGTYNKNNGAIYICQTERYTENINRIRYLLNKLGLFCSEYVYEYRYKERTYKRHDFYISKEKAKVIKSIIPDKKPTMELLHLKHDELIALFNGLIGGDGSYKSNSNNKLGEFYQKDEFVLDWFQILCLHLGFKSSKNSKKHCVSWGKKGWAKIDPGWVNKKIYKEYYKGEVWCVKVPTGAFVVRRNGKVFITGNSGFPKSHDISKAIDKKLGAEREVVGYTKGRSSPIHGGGQSVGKDDPVTVPATPEAKQWDGWGTCLKPANEPIVLARKPISEKTIAENVMKWGTGGLNIDGCRVEYVSEYDMKHQHDIARGQDNATNGKMFGGKQKSKASTHTPQGRFPANVILDEEAGRMLDEQSGITISKDGGKSGTHFSAGNKGVKRTDARKGHNDSGGASRFFYCAKASKKERGEGNNHPTVKPVKLIEYLITLVTPPNGIVLDPFFGSGTTGIAAVNLGFNYIGIELDEQYIEIARRRINAAGK